MNTIKLGRLVFGVMYLFAAVVHLLLAVFNPTAYSGLGESALLPFYKDLFTSVVPVYATTFALTLAILELLMGGLILSKGVFAKTGFILSVLFQILLAPLGWWGFCNVILAVVQVLWLKESFAYSAFSEPRMQPTAS